MADQGERAVQLLPAGVGQRRRLSSGTVRLGQCRVGCGARVRSLGEQAFHLRGMLGDEPAELLDALMLLGLRRERIQ